MKKLTLFLFLASAVVALGCQPAKAQDVPRGFPKSPSSEPTPIVAAPDPEKTPAGPRIDLLEVQREAVELSKTAQSIPLDVENIKKGMLPKDLLQKLKQIEKLSKHLRSQLNP